jgi:hypothetical protein
MTPQKTVIMQEMYQCIYIYEKKFALFKIFLYTKFLGYEVFGRFKLMI